MASGVAVVDNFKLSCSSWTDPEGDALLQYRFGYELLDAPSTSAVWFDWASDSARLLSLPSGRIRALAQVRDDCGATTDLLQAELAVADGGTAVVSEGTWRFLPGPSREV